MQNIITKFKAIPNSSESGIFSGYASVFNVLDTYNDVILPGAFKGIFKDNVKLLWQHDDATPIGTILELRESTRGLFMKAQLTLNSIQGSDAYALLKAKAIDGLSIGFEVLEYFHDKDARYIKAAKVWEISLVTFPANDAARILEVKQQDFFTLHSALDRAILAIK